MDVESININRQLTDGNIFKDYLKTKNYYLINSTGRGRPLRLLRPKPFPDQQKNSTGPAIVS